MPISNPAYEALKADLRRKPKRWLVTGAAGFIGSHLVEALLNLDQNVIGLDNFCAGKRVNLEHIKNAVAPESWKRFELIEGDIRDLATCQRACSGIQYVLHEAALCSVPASIADPSATHATNVTGFLYILTAARDQKVQRVVFASTCAVYGTCSDLPLVETSAGNCLSPYAGSKYMNEIYAGVFAQNYGLSSIGLRYFNVFGPRQDPNGAYAAVIPRWISAMAKGERPIIYGDGKTTRDFVYVEDVVQANLLATSSSSPNQVYNVGSSARVSLNELLAMLRSGISAFTKSSAPEPQYLDFRAGDIRHSQSDTTKARKLLGFQPVFSMEEGLDKTLRSFLSAC